MSYRICLWAGLILSSALVQAQNLNEAFEAALVVDPTYQKATADYRAAKESVPQAVSVMLPSIYGQASTSRVRPSLDDVHHYNLRSDSLNLSQPIFNFGHWMQLSEAYATLKQAQASYANALQDLIVRVSDQYFTVLSAADDVRFAKSQAEAFSHHLNQAQHRFQAGLIAQVDVQEAQARHDTAAANTIAAENSLHDALERLMEMTDQVEIKHLGAPLDFQQVRLARPSPSNVEAWVDTAIRNNYAIQAAFYAKQAANFEVHRQRSGHLPTVSLDGTIQRNNTTPDRLVVANSSVGLKVSVPLFQGGVILSKTREAQAYHQGAQAGYDAALKSVVSQTRRAYRGILADMSRIQALAQAVASNETALRATQAAYDIGTRSMGDVLDAQTDLLQAQNAHAKAYYDYFVQQLMLKQATGALSPNDMMQISRWLELAMTPQQQI